MDESVVLVLSEHGARQSVWRGAVDQLQNLFVAVLRINVDAQNWPEDFLKTHNRLARVSVRVQGAGLDSGSLHLIHDGVLRVRGLHDGRLHKVALLIVTLAPGDDSKPRRRLGVIDPLLYASKRLQHEHKDRDSETNSITDKGAWRQRTIPYHRSQLRRRC